MNTPAERKACSDQVIAMRSRAASLKAFVGLDGFVDEIVDAVNKRDSATHYDRLETISRLAERIAGASGRSTNIEIVPTKIKLGGNGPIMANALCSLGVRTTYAGALGVPVRHPVFNELAERAVHAYSLANPGHTHAVEFNDGKVMLVKSSSLAEITWQRLVDVVGAETLRATLEASDLLAFVNWTMIPHMTEIWEKLRTGFLQPSVTGRPHIFFDLADPEKRTHEDIGRALAVIAEFQSSFHVILGLNEKEAFEIAHVLGLPPGDGTPAGLCDMALEMTRRLKIDTLVVHPVRYAIAVTSGVCSLVHGPNIPKPAITTGAGDHFNSGFCLGKLLGLGNPESLLMGVTTSGFYVKNARSPGIDDIAEMMRRWPT